MRAILIFLGLLYSINQAFGQGTVLFLNGPSTLISVGTPGQEQPISDPANSYYFGLLIAPPGTVDRDVFSFAGVYATNVGPSSPGSLTGGLHDTPVPGWVAGAMMSFFVAGWSANLGHDWNQQWMTGAFGGTGLFGLSDIATGRSGGLGAPPISPLILFGGVSGIQTGFDLTQVPEPSTFCLVVAGAAALSRRSRSLRKR